MPKKIDLTGQTLGRVEVLAKLPRRMHGMIAYRVRCLDCGHRWRKAGAQLAAYHRAGKKGCPRCGKAATGSAAAARLARRRAAVVRRWLAGETLGAIAADLGVTRQAVQYRLSRGLAAGDVVAALRSLPPERLLAAVLSLPAVARRKVLLASLTPTPEATGG